MGSAPAKNTSGVAKLTPDATATKPTTAATAALPGTTAAAGTNVIPTNAGAAAPVTPAAATPAVVAPKPVVAAKPVVPGAPPNATPGPANTSGYHMPGSSNLYFPGSMGGGSHGSTHNAAQARADANKPKPDAARLKLANAISAKKKKSNPKYYSSKW